MKFGTLFPIIALAASQAIGAPIVLTNATATFSQGAPFGNFPVSQTVDGIFASPNGWAIHPNAVDQTAVYEIATNPAGSAGALFTFVMTQNLTTPQHTLGRFRFSVTGDDPGTFADGLQSGGDVMATWTPLTPLTALATGGAILTPQFDKSILASGPSPSTSVYTITALSSLSNITGLRLEVLEDPSLPFNGPGRQPANGNFVLSELQVDAVAIVVPEPTTASILGIGILFVLTRRRLS